MKSKASLWGGNIAIKIANNFYKEERFLTHVVARELHISFSWMLDYLSTTLLQPLLLSFIPKILLSSYVIIKLGYHTRESQGTNKNTCMYKTQQCLKGAQVICHTCL